MTSKLTPTAIAVSAILLAIGAATWLDLTPQIDPDFFFAENDPQIQETNAIERDFPSSSQIAVRVSGPDIEADSYRSQIAQLSTALSALANVTSVRSILTTPNYNDPLWRPILVSRAGDASYILLGVRPSNPSDLINQLQTVTALHQQSDFDIAISGVPYVIELIRRSLMRDLIVFSAAAMAVFGIAIGFVYRRLWIAIGTLLTAVSAAVATLSVLQMAGVAIGLLTANLVTIVFVLTLSHIVFLTSNWRQETSKTGDASPAQQVRAAVQRTLLPSFWCMATTTLGFISLLVASAKPLRELGVAGATGTVIAIVVAYVMYPPFLRATTPLREPSASAKSWLPTGRRGIWLGAIGVITLFFTAGVTRLSTDPSLLTYFSAKSQIRHGLELIDGDGGSSPLRLVVQDKNGRRFDEPEGLIRLRAIHDRLAQDSDVGSVVSPSLLLSEIQRSPLAANLTPQQVLDIPLIAPIIAPFFSSDRTRAHFMLRMKESGRGSSRDHVIDRIRESLDEFNAEPALTGGLYDLQAKLSDLLASSLRLTLAGLIILFGGIGWFLTRSLRTAAILASCLSVVPIVILGAFGHARLAMDIISSPAANVALAMGVDSMIHLVIRARVLTATNPTAPWTKARDQLWHPIAGATLIISAGFGIFGLSVFPPTARFGLAVILGTVTAATMALIAMPMLSER